MIWQVDSNKLGLGVGMGLFVATPLILTLCSALCVSIKHKLDSPNISSSTTSSSSIYTGTVYHNRFGAIPNKFNYPLVSPTLSPLALMKMRMRTTTASNMLHSIRIHTVLHPRRPEPNRKHYEPPLPPLPIC